MYVQHCKFSPVEALKTATSVAARCFKLNDRGIIIEGKKADLLLVRGNPTENISDTLNIERVWKHGVHHSVAVV
jgi:imidazolonepropionase-like amidohydrolase